MNLRALSTEYLQDLRARIERNYIVTNEDCWEWVLGKGHAGHGKVSVKHKTQMAHRVYYQLVKGWLPDSLVLDHFICDNPPCINPDHLKPVSHWENTRRGTNIVALNARKNQCIKGHPFNDDNTVLHNRVGWKGQERTVRACRVCANTYSHRRDLQRTMEYRAKGLNSKGKPMSPIWKKKYGIL